MTGAVLVLGLLVTFIMVKDTKVDRNYIKNEKGELERRQVKVAEDEEPNDDGSDVDLGIPEVVDGTVGFVKGLTLSCWGKTKLLVR